MLVCTMMLQSRRSERVSTETLTHYLEQTLHRRIRIHAFEHSVSLPAFLERTYQLYESSIAGQQCIFLIAGENFATPSDIAKHVALVRSVVPAIVVFVAASLSTHNRARLVAQGTSFVVPGNQLYIPELAMDLREYFRAPKIRSADSLSPVAQAVLFHHLLRPDARAVTPSTIAERLHYSAMSIGRAFDDLAAAGLAETRKIGKEKHLKFKTEGRALLQTAHSLLRSPVRTVKYIREVRTRPAWKLAGESALAELTDLSPPKIDTYAVAASGWKIVANRYDLTETEPAESAIAVETWSYDPAGLSDTHVVDRLSLYAQFWNSGDERISKVAESLLEHPRW